MAAPNSTPDPQKPTFRGCYEIFLAARPEVLPVLRECESHQWGWHTRFKGTAAELISAGLACAEMFAAVGTAGQRSMCDENGDKVTLSRHPHRSGDRWTLTRHFQKEIFLPEYPDARACGILDRKRWKDYAPAAESATAEILKRFERRQP